MFDYDSGRPLMASTDLADRIGARHEQVLQRCQHYADNPEHLGEVFFDRVVPNAVAGGRPKLTAFLDPLAVMFLLPISKLGEFPEVQVEIANEAKRLAGLPRERDFKAQLEREREEAKARKAEEVAEEELLAERMRTPLLDLESTNAFFGVDNLTKPERRRASTVFDRVRGYHGAETQDVAYTRITFDDTVGNRNATRRIRVQTVLMSRRVWVLYATFLEAAGLGNYKCRLITDGTIDPKENIDWEALETERADILSGEPVKSGLVKDMEERERLELLNSGQQLDPDDTEGWSRTTSTYTASDPDPLLEDDEDEPEDDEDWDDPIEYAERQLREAEQREAWADFLQGIRDHKNQTS